MSRRGIIGATTLVATGSAVGPVSGMRPSEVGETSTVSRSTGRLEVDVVHENGDRAKEVNALVIWQDDTDDGPYDIVERYPTVDVPYVFEDLPSGHEYYVNAYLLDHLGSGVGWISLSPGSTASETIRVLNPVWMRPLVVDSNGNPLENAVLEVRTHEDDPEYVWRRVTTGSEGYPTTPGEKVWLYPSERDAGFYILDVYFDGERVANEHLNVLTGNRDLTVETNAVDPTTTTATQPEATTTPPTTTRATTTQNAAEGATTTQQSQNAETTTDTASLAPAAGSGPATLGEWVNVVLIGLLSTEALVALGTAVVAVLIAVTWKYSENRE